jgi:hypothetical protein
MADQEALAQQLMEFVAEVETKAGREPPVQYRESIAVPRKSSKLTVCEKCVSILTDDDQANLERILETMRRVCR